MTNCTDNKFEVLLTSNGLKSVYDPISLHILEHLRKEEHSLADLSKILNVPSSSLYFQMDKMIENGLIEKVRTEGNKNSTRYKITSMPIFKMTGGKTDIDTESVVPVILNKKDCNKYRQVLYTFWTYSAHIGLDLTKIMEFYGEAVALFYKDRFASNKVEEIISNVRKFLISIGIPAFEVFSYAPLSVVIKSDMPITPEYGAMYAPYVGLLKGAIRNNLGVSYDVKHSEIYGLDSNMLKIDLYPSNINPIFSDDIVSLMDKENYSVFSIVSIGDKVTVIDSDTQTKLLESLDKRPMTIVDLTTATGMPRSTITSNISKMEEIGILTSMKSTDDTTYYFPTCTTLFRRNGPMRFSKKWNEILKSQLDDTVSGFHKGLLGYILFLYDSLGFDTSIIMRSLGRFAIEDIKKVDGTLPLKEIFDRYREAGIKDVDMELISAVPFRFALKTKSENEPIAKGFLEFYGEIISSAIVGSNIQYCGRTYEYSREGDEEKLVMSIHSMYPAFQ